MGVVVCVVADEVSCIAHFERRSARGDSAITVAIQITSNPEEGRVNLMLGKYAQHDWSGLGKRAIVEREGHHTATGGGRMHRTLGEKPCTRDARVGVELRPRRWIWK
jgi:hypothetical protein